MTSIDKGGIEREDNIEYLKIIYGTDERYGSKAYLTLRVMEAFKGKVVGLSVANIAEAVALPLPSARVLVNRLRSAGLLSESLKIGRSSLYEISEAGLAEIYGRKKAVS